MSNAEASVVAESDQQPTVASTVIRVEKKNDPVPPTARQPLVMGIQIGTLEAIFLLMEFIFGSTIFTAVMRGVLNPLLSSIFSPYVCSFFYTSLGGIIITIWCMVRFGRTLKISPLHLLQRFLSLPNDTFSFSYPTLSITSFARTVMACQVAGFLVMLVIQHFTGVWVYSFDPILAPSGGLNLCHLAEVVLLAPLREEIVFRGILASTFYRRVGGQAPDRKLRAIIMSALFFGAVHAVNLMNPAFSKPYVLAQVVFGVLVGIVYGCELAMGSLWGCIVMHMLNNLASSVVDMSALHNHPLIWAAFAESLCVYGCLCWLGVRAVRAQGVRRWSAVDGMGTEPLPYSEDEDEEGEEKKKKKRVKKTKKPSAEEQVADDGAASTSTDTADVITSAAEPAVIATVRGRRARKVE